MTDTIRSLDRIETETCYSVFEKDQVLTPEQLNSVSGYLDDQERMTRVALLGVGIACGLWARLDDGQVVLGHGVGTTTDGDLAFLPGETVYDRYKPYDRSSPVYKPFRRGEDVILAYELVRKGESDSRALVLGGFAAREGRSLDSLAAVLYVESYLRDEDLCTGTDCDNRGKDSVHTLRLLLVERDTAAALAAALGTPEGAARSPLRPVAAARPVLPGIAIRSAADLAAVYRKACALTHERLAAAFKGFYAPCEPFLRDVLAADPGPRWVKALEQVRDATQDLFVQYYYDFLKDLADTWNAFLDALFGDTAVCCPDLEAFPKHLVLGALDPAQRSARERTGFYPSPMVSAVFEQREHARALARKLDTLIVSFAPLVPSEVRITPSAFEDRPLEERAIPFYYAVREAAPVHRAWSHALTRRGMERYNYSYNAERYAAEGAAARPLEAQLGAFGFFRIEGHVGKPLDAVKAALEREIRDSNLPIDLEYLRFDKPPKGWRPPWRFPDLYRFHYLMRAEVASQLTDADKFGDSFVEQVKNAAGTVITDADNDNVPVLGTAQTKVELMKGQAKMALQKISGAAYEPDWNDALTKATQSAAELNEALSPVTKKEFVSPLDPLISGQPARWLDWLDILINDAEDKESERAQLSEFLREHPGLEHYAGVLRGGTFVLVCDAQNTVVADFMLPYSSREQRVEPPKPPPLPPRPRPPIVFEKPIRLVTLPDKFRFDKLRTELSTGLQKDFAVQKQFFDGVIAGAGGKLGSVTTTFPDVTGGLGGKGFSDPVLNAHTLDTVAKTQVVDTIRTRLLDPQLDDATRGTLEKQLEVAETQLASTIVTVTEYVAGANLDVKTGTEGAAAMALASSSLSKVGNIEALTQVEKGLNTIGTKAGTAPEVRVVIGGMLGGRGML